MLTFELQRNMSDLHISVVIRFLGFAWEKKCCRPRYSFSCIGFFSIDIEILIEMRRLELYLFEIAPGLPKNTRYTKRKELELAVSTKNQMLPVISE